MAELKYYAVERRSHRSTEKEDVGIPLVTVFAFDNPMVMSDWITAGNNKRRRGGVRITREEVGAAHSSTAALYQVFNNKPGRARVVEYKIDENYVPKEPPRNKGGWINIRIPKEINGANTIQSTHGNDPENQRSGSIVVQLPKGIAPVEKAPWKNGKRSKTKVDISGGTFEVTARERRPIEERGRQGWRQGVIKSLEGSDFYEIGFRERSKYDEPWKVRITLPEPNLDGTPQNVFVEIQTLDSALEMLYSANKPAPVAEVPLPTRTYPHPSQFEAQEFMNEAGRECFAWHGVNEHIMATHYVDDECWTFETLCDTDPELNCQATGNTFEEAYTAHFELSNAKNGNWEIANPGHAGNRYPDVNALKFDVGSIEEPKSMELGVPFEGAKIVGANLERRAAVIAR